MAIGITIDEGLATLRLSREHGNAINEELVESMIGACRRLNADDEVRGVLLAAEGKLFSPGLDLQELGEYDRPRMTRFLDRFNACILMLYTLHKPVVAAMHGHAVAGGCVLALTADWRVLREGALVGLNEVRIGVPFPFGVAMILRESVPRARLGEVAMFGRNYEGQEAVDSGLVHELHWEKGFEAHCRSRLAELADRDPRAFAITKRYLRSSTVERIRANDPKFTADFLDAWFSPSTGERLRKIVEDLKKR